MLSFRDCTGYFGWPGPPLWGPANINKKKRKKVKKSKQKRRKERWAARARSTGERTERGHAEKIETM